MKAHWKRAYHYWCSYSKKVDAATTVMTDCSKRTLDGPLRDSAVARLLVEGRLPAELAATSSVVGLGDPVDLSRRRPSPPPAIASPVSPTIKTEVKSENDSVVLLQRSIRQEMDLLAAVKPTEDANGTWKCRYCPYQAPTAKTLHSHYQFHQQLLTSQLSSLPHVEWLAAYRRAKEDAERLRALSSGDESASPPSDSHEMSMSTPVTSAPSPVITRTPQAVGPVTTSVPAAPPGGATTSSQTAGHSASGFLRSIVQAVMQQPKTAGNSVTPGTIYASLLHQEQQQQQQQQKRQQEVQEHEMQQEQVSSDSHRKLSPPALVEPPMHTPRVASPIPIRPEKLYRRGKRKLSMCHSSRSKMAALDHGVNSDFSDIESLSVSSLRSENLSRLSTNALSPRSDESRSPHFSEDSLPNSVSQSVLARASPLTAPVLALPTAIESIPPFPISTPSPQHHLSPNERDDRWQIETEPVRLDYQHRPYSPPESVHSSVSHQRSYVSHSRRASTDSDISVGNISVGSPEVRKSTSSYSADDSNYHSGTSTHSPASFKDEGEHKGIQCELLVPTSDREMAARLFMDDLSAHAIPAQRATVSLTKCQHCGISFDDEVLFSIHMGVHSHVDPYDCNVCGRSCGNRYAFYTHLMRGHQSP